MSVETTSTTMFRLVTVAMTPIEAEADCICHLYLVSDQDLLAEAVSSFRPIIIVHLSMVRVGWGFEVVLFLI
jgi:hypothetical protein